MSNRYNYDPRQTYNIPGKIDSPETLETSEILEVPETLETSEILEVPETLDTSSTPEMSDTPTQPEISKLIYGIVANCEALRVRSEASTINSKIIDTIKVGTLVTIKETVNGFYQVITPDKKEGFCMEQYISIQ